MKKKLLIITAVLAVVIIGAICWVVFFWQPGPSYNSVAYLVTPEITTLPAETMLTIKLTGEPSAISGEAIGKLYQIYSKLGGKWDNNVAPRARWGMIEDFNLTATELTGTFGLPAPDGVTELPSGTDDSIELKTWQYGEVAQILHVGSYDNEQTTIDKLHNFITEQGYKITGEHEEVYLKSTNMFGFGSEKNFLTIIRYPVTKIK